MQVAAECQADAQAWLLCHKGAALKLSTVCAAERRSVNAADALTNAVQIYTALLQHSRLASQLCKYTDQI